MTPSILLEHGTKNKTKRFAKKRRRKTTVDTIGRFFETKGSLITARSAEQKEHKISTTKEKPRK